MGNDSDPIHQAIKLSAGHEPTPTRVAFKPTPKQTREEIRTESVRLRDAVRQTIEIVRQTIRQSEQIMAELTTTQRR
jgi:hypothetical protein